MGSFLSKGRPPTSCTTAEEGARALKATADLDQHSTNPTCALHHDDDSTITHPPEDIMQRPKEDEEEEEENSFHSPRTVAETKTSISRAEGTTSSKDELNNKEGVTKKMATSTEPSTCIATTDALASSSAGDTKNCIHNDNSTSMDSSSQQRQQQHLLLPQQLPLQQQQPSSSYDWPTSSNNNNNAQWMFRSTISGSSGANSWGSFFPNGNVNTNSNNMMMMNNMMMTMMQQQERVRQLEQQAAIMRQQQSMLLQSNNSDGWNNNSKKRNLPHTHNMVVTKKQRKAYGKMNEQQVAQIKQQFEQSGIWSLQKFYEQHKERIPVCYRTLAKKMKVSKEGGYIYIHEN